ncbi:MAG TPA: sugar phosphate isomerase/epimerase [Bryobacteraceae bacterium]|nr:sugar phosphate isomerase/epimerase [Bryobacteraceae bacterium]
MYSRRAFGKAALAGVAWPCAARTQSVYGGVHVGAAAYGYPGLPLTPGAADTLDAWIQVFRDIGYVEMELANNILEPPQPNLRGPGQQERRQKAREEIRQWRLSTPGSHFTEVRRKLDRSGIRPTVYTCNGMGDDFTEAEIDTQFKQARELGVTVLASSTQVSVAEKLIPFAERHKMRVAFHNHSDVTHPNEFATPASFEKAWEMSKYYLTNLDVGHFTAANLDPVSFIEAHHARISHIHIKDRKKEQGPNRPWGEGDTPIKEALQLIKKNRYPIPCYQEFEYRIPEGSSSAAEWKRCREFLINGLA